MNERNFEKLQVVDFDFDQDWVPKRAKKLRPHIYKDGLEYCCVFGPDPQVGIFGCGNDAEAAIMEWEDDLNERITRLTGDDNAAHIAVQRMGDK